MADTDTSASTSTTASVASSVGSMATGTTTPMTFDTTGSTTTINPEDLAGYYTTIGSSTYSVTYDSSDPSDKSKYTATLVTDSTASGSTGTTGATGTAGGSTSDYAVEIDFTTIDSKVDTIEKKFKAINEQLNIIETNAQKLCNSVKNAETKELLNKFKKRINKRKNANANQIAKMRKDIDSDVIQHAMEISSSNKEIQEQLNILMSSMALENIYDGVNDGTLE